ISLLLLVIPALIFFCVYFVVIPAAVMEKSGILGSFSRSAQLTRGNRWRILGLVLLGMLIIVTVSIGFGLVTGIIVIFAGPGNDALLAAGLIEAVVNAVVMVFNACLVSVTYYELRHLEGGTSLEKLSSVFD
ncbi:MAG: glycerophosphoryl diester phosphodiesterase membrane domain-containing protein, partial [Nitratireductor sp.]